MTLKRILFGHRCHFHRNDHSTTIFVVRLLFWASLSVLNKTTLILKGSWSCLRAFPRIAWTPSSPCTGCTTSIFTRPLSGGFRTSSLNGKHPHFRFCFSDVSPLICHFWASVPPQLSSLFYSGFALHFDKYPPPQPPYPPSWLTTAPIKIVRKITREYFQLLLSASLACAMQSFIKLRCPHHQHNIIIDHQCTIG